jgi:hypothetical protein
MDKKGKLPLTLRGAYIQGIFIIFGSIIGSAIIVVFSNPAIVSEMDTINAFRVVSQSKNELIIDVDYIYNSVYGEQIYIGACLYDNGEKVGQIPQSYGGWCGYEPTLVPDVGRGTARLVIHPLLSIQQFSDEIEIFLYRWGYGSTYIASRRFPFIREWEP